MFLHYFRTTDDGRVLMGSGSGPIGSGAAWTRASRPTAPRLAEQRVGFAGSSPGRPRLGSRTPGAGRSTSRPTTSPSSAPRRGTRIHYGAGYSGHGTGPSWLGGQALASLVTGADERMDCACRSRTGDRAGRCRPSHSLPRRLPRPGRDPRLRGGRGGGPRHLQRSRGGRRSTFDRDGNRDAVSFATARPTRGVR